MKKHLLCTSAIIGCAMAAPATAQEWDLNWGGYMNQHVAYTDLSGNLAGTGAGQTDNDGIGFHSTTEIIFSPSITLDNGITFGINVQMEGENNGGGAIGIDETYMTISGDTLGRIVIGSENSAGYTSMVAAPGVTSMYINSPSISAFIPLSGSTGGPLPGIFRGAMVSAYTEVGRNNDVDRLTYFTPSFNGLTVGVSYARNNGGNALTNHNNNNAAGLTDIFDIGLNYSQTFGSTSVTVGARYGTADSNVGGISDPDTWGIGMQIGFADFTVGGHYAENDNGVAAGVGDQEGWSFGVTYDAPGPWAFEALTFQGESKATGAAGANEEYTAYRIGASRDLGPGVDWDIYAVFAEVDDNGTAGTEIEGTVIGTAINLSF
ncbi:porin [Roseovarius sp. ZX-A-9]|uniref:porin n=1 Tax=Roseovarius sp. ZX-A-9 TaxID=3014783 RepID=UPI00232D5AD7|nr:porin [Roseovarius sp. ZX-A-9]